MKDGMALLAMATILLGILGHSNFTLENMQIEVAIKEILVSWNYNHFNLLF